jgi:hypothetical protein
MIFEGLAFKELKEDEVLFFIRIRGKSSYFSEVYSHRFIDLFESIDQHRCISEYKKDAHIHIDLNAVSRDYLYEEEYNHLTSLSSIEEIIKRCRGLRAISYVEASKLIARCYLFFISFYNASPSLKLVVTGTIDNYVMDLMVRVGKDLGVNFFALTGSLMSPEYHLSTVRGKLTSLGKIDKSSLKAFEEKILSNINNCSTPKIRFIIKGAIYNYLSYHYRFMVRYLFKYKVLGRMEYEYRFAPFLHGFKSIKQLVSLRYLNDAPELFKDKEIKKAYIPLHWYPEATTDYWIESLYHVDYYTSVMNTIDQLQKQGYEVYAKEHPHFILSRESKFYQAIKNKGCNLLSPFICTKKVFDNVDLVVVWNGSTGIEALLYGKETRKVVNSYYGDNLISDIKGNKIVEINKTIMAKKCLEKIYSSSFKT